MVYVSNYEDCMAMGIEVVLKMHNHIVWYLKFHTLVVEWYCVRNSAILLSAPSGVVPSFVESVSVLLLIL